MLTLGRLDGAVRTSSRRSPSRTRESEESKRSLWMCVCVGGGGGGGGEREGTRKEERYRGESNSKYLKISLKDV